VTIRIEVVHTFRIEPQAAPQPDPRIGEIRAMLLEIKSDLETIMLTQADFEQRLASIDANTTRTAAAATASAQSAIVIKDSLAALRAELDQVLTDAGLPASKEQSILNRLDALVSSSQQVATTSEQLATFLQQTASPTSTPEPQPVPAPEPVPIPEPAPTV